MPTVLIDSSTDSLLVALADGATILAERTSSDRAQALLALLDECVDAAGVTRADLARVLVGTGPGGFTGLRVGVATARGLASALGVPIAGVSTLAAVAAAGVTTDEPEIVASVDAKRGELFVQRFLVRAPTDGVAGTITPRAPFEVIAVEALADFAGDLPVVASPPTATGLLVAAAGSATSAGARFTTPSHILPDYGRDADAKPSAPVVRAATTAGQP